MIAPITMAPLSEVCEINPRHVNGLAPDMAVTFVPMSAVDEKTGSIVAPELRQYQEVAKGYTPFRDNDVLFAKITPCMENGKCAIASGLENGKGFGSTEFHILRASDRVVPEWVYYFIRQEKVRKFAASNMTGTAGQQRVPKSVFDRLLIPVPPLPIQKQITAILEKADEAREKRRQANQLTEQFLQSAFLDMFGDPVTNPKGWAKKPLVELCENDGDLRCGPFGSQVKIADYQTEGIPVWDIEDVKAEFKSQPRYRVSSKKAEELSNYYLQAGDIVMTRRATIGISAVYPTSAGRGIMHSALLRIRVNQKKVDSIFLSNQLSKSKDVEDQISRFSSGAIFQSINVSKLKAVHVLIPPLPEQQRFVALVEKVEGLREKQRGSEKELENLFNSLMQRAFKGELVQ